MAREAAILRFDERDLPGGAAALAKGLYLLEVIGERESPARFKDLQRATGLPKGTLARLLNTLVAFRLVRHDPRDNTYRLGNRLLELAHRVWETFDLREAAGPELDRLAAELDETIAIGALDNDQIVYVEQRSHGGPFGFRIEVGRRAPLHCTAVGKALLAFAPAHEQRAILSRIAMERHTATTLTDRDTLVADLALVRARGYAISNGEHVEGVVSAAAPIFDHARQAIGAIGVFGPSSRIPGERLHVIGRDLMEAARTMSGNVSAPPVSIHSRKAPLRQVDPDVACALAAGASLAEGPFWAEGEQSLYWVDILEPAVHRFHPQSGRNETCRLPRLVSAVIARRSGGLIVTTANGVEELDFGSGALRQRVDPEQHQPENRFNDAKCDAAGRLWAGTMSLDATRQTGALYCVGSDDSWRRMDQFFTVSNGLDWSPDGRTFYFTDSSAGAIYAYDFDPAEGAIARRRLFARVEPAEGRPDGLTVDVEGCVWSALWDGWCIRRFDPSGRVMRDLRLPAPRPTSVTFGGPGLRTLFITTARVRLPANILAEAPLSGGLFAANVGVAGRAAHLFGG